MSNYDPRTHTSPFTRIVRHEAFPGILLMLSAVAALLVANSSLVGVYDGTLGTYLAVTFGGEGLEKPLLFRRVPARSSRRRGSGCRLR